jgi:hypothetical protein
MFKIFTVLIFETGVSTCNEAGSNNSDGQHILHGNWLLWEPYFIFNFKYALYLLFMTPITILSSNSAGSSHILERMETQTSCSSFTGVFFNILAVPQPLDSFFLEFCNGNI